MWLSNFTCEISSLNNEWIYSKFGSYCNLVDSSFYDAKQNLLLTILGNIYIFIVEGPYGPCVRK